MISPVPLRPGPWQGAGPEMGMPHPESKHHAKELALMVYLVSGTIPFAAHLDAWIGRTTGTGKSFEDPSARAADIL